MAWRASVAALVCFGACGAATPLAVAVQQPGVVIHRTEHGIPHVVADGDRGIGYGYGYAVAQDNICLLAESYVTVAGERSRFFGPDGTFVFHANRSEHSNLASDFFYRQLLVEGTLMRTMRKPPPIGAKPAVRRLIRGYVAGYNRYLAETGVDRISDPACRGEPWVRPITEELVYAHFGQLASLAGGGIAITGIGEAQPPPPGGATRSSQSDTRRGFAELGERLRLDGTGSNAIALGRKATRSGAGVVLGNPHLPWEGGYRLYHAHFTIPGEMDVSGATFIGVPLVLIGHTRGLAWSHTTSPAFRFTPFELKLVPGSPTTYLVDGEPRQMTPRELTVEVKREDGSLGSETRTLWSTEYGPMLTELLGLPVFPWTATSGFAFADANAENLRYLNHFHEVDRAETVPELDAILRRNQGIPWATTLAADAAGRTLYADASVVPHVTDEHARRCNTAPHGVVGFEQLRLPVLDGSRSSCRWGSDSDAVTRGIFGPGNLPFLRRADYVTNSNDSHWLSNPSEPLEGFARIIGDERSERSLRTRLGLRMVREQLAGVGRFTLRKLRRMQFNSRHGAAELVREELVALCRSLPVLPSSSGGAVAKGDACEVLAAWDGRDRADSRGALLFRRWAERALIPPVPGQNAVGGGPPPAGTWRDSFDPERPVDTPRELNTANPDVQAALGDAVRDLRDAEIPLDAPLGEYQFDERAGERIPMHGGPGAVGVFNALNVQWDPERGYPDVPHGSTFLMASELRGRCPPTHTLVAYSQSSDPTSRWHADQTRFFSRGAWVRERYCTRHVLRSPALRATRLGCLPRRAGMEGFAIAWLRPRMPSKLALRVLGWPTARGGGSSRWCVRGRGGVRTALVGRGTRRRIGLVATTVPAQRVAGARPGARLRAPGWRRLGRSGLRVRRLGSRSGVAALRSGRVRWVGLVSTRTVARPGRLVALARKAGF